MKIRFGSIIVSGSGKIDGNVVRNFRGQALLCKMPQVKISTSRKTFVNRYLLSRCFQWYGTLEASERAGWNANALITPFIDRYGNEKHLSGRELVTHLALNMLYVNTQLGLAADFSPLRPTLLSSYVIVDTAAATINIAVNDYSGCDKLIVYFAKNVNEMRNLTAKQLRVAYGHSIMGHYPEYIYAMISEKFGPLIAGQWYTFGFRGVSPCGMSSPMCIIKTQAV